MDEKLKNYFKSEDAWFTFGVSTLTLIMIGILSSFMLNVWLGLAIVSLYGAAIVFLLKRGIFPSRDNDLEIKESEAETVKKILYVIREFNSKDVDFQIVYKAENARTAGEAVTATSTPSQQMIYGRRNI